MGQPICPKCQNLDAVYKVSVLYENSGSIETYQRVVPPPPGTKWAPLVVTEERHRRSNLGQKLSPPARPLSKSYPQEATIFSVLLALLFVSGLAAVYVGNMIIGQTLQRLNSQTQSLGFWNDPVAVAEYHEAERRAWLTGGAIGIVGLIATGFVFVSMNRGRNEWYRKAFPEYKQALADWEHAKVKWNALYYCLRDDVVFDPAHSMQWRYANDMRELLY